MKVRGFTLVEMVMTIVVMGVIFLGIAGYIELGTRGYTDTVDRQRLQNQARFVMEKLSREIRHAVPNSFVLEESGKCISFYPIKYSGFYTQDEANGNIQFILDNQATPVSFTSGERIVINPSRQSNLATTGNNGASAALASATESGGVYTLSDTFSSDSVASRHYIYLNKVTYCISTTGRVTRAVNSDPAVNVGEGLDRNDSRFSYEGATLQRGGLVHIDLLFVNDGEQSSYKHDVQVLNVP